MKKRILSILLVLVMIAGMLPVQAFAEETDGLTLETGHVSEFMTQLFLSRIVLQGVSGTVTGAGENWEIELAEDTDMTQPITFQMTSSVPASGKASFYFWADGIRSEKSVADADPGTVTVQPQWLNGRATVVLAVGTASKVSGTKYTLELSVKGVAEEDFNTVKTGETGDYKAFVTKIALGGVAATNSTLSDTNFSGSSSGHTATVTYVLDAMPTEPVQLTFTMVSSSSTYIDCNDSGTRTKVTGTHTAEVDLGKGLVYVFKTYSSGSNSTIRGTYTIRFQVAGVDNNTAPVLKDSGVTGEEKTLNTGEVYTLDLSAIFRDGELDKLTYTVQLGDAEPVSAKEDYSLPLTAAGDYTLVFRASDGKLTSEDCYTVKLKVTENTAPTLTGSAADTQTIQQYDTFTLDLSKVFADAEGDTLTYTVSMGGGAAQTTGANYSYTANTAETVVLVFQAKDHGLTSPEYTLTLQVNHVAKTTVSTNCAKTHSYDSWLGTIDIIGAEVTSWEWNMESGHDEKEIHVLSIQLDGSTPDDAVLQLTYTEKRNTSTVGGSVSGPSSVTLHEGKGSVTVTSSARISSWGPTRTYILNFTNKVNSAPVAEATARATVTVGDAFDIDLSQVFTDPDGEALTYTVTTEGATSDTGSNFRQVISESGEHVFVFTAVDPWGATATHTVTVTATPNQNTYNAILKIPEGIIPKFYITGDPKGENGDTYGDDLTATAGTAADGFVPYTVAVPENISRISFRGVDADGNNWGGMTAEVSKDMEPVTVIKLLGVIPSRVNNVYVTPEQALFRLKDKDGCYAVSGSTTTDSYGITNFRFLAVAFGTDDLAKAYTTYVTPQGELTATYVETVGINKTFVKNEPQQLTQLSLTLKSGFTVTVPEGATVQAFQWKQYYKADEIPVSDTVENADGTVSWMFVKSDAARMTYRASMEGKLTKVGYVNGDGVTITWDETDASPDCRTPYDTSTLYGSRGDDSIVVNVNGQNNLRMDVGGTFRLRGYRIWEVINSDTQNVMIQPDMRYSLTGDDIVTVTPVTSGNGNGKNNWLDLTATGSGVAYLELTYDAMQVVTGNQSSFGGEGLAGFVFNACDPARTALVVVQVGNAATDVSFGIQCSSILGSTGVPWDAEFDTLYFVGDSGELKLSPTVTSGAIAKVEVSGDKGASWTELTAENGVYTAPIVSGNNIIRVTKEDGTQAHQVVRGDKVTYTMTETSGDGDNVPEPGETFRVKLNGLHNPIGKMSGNYNPGYGGGQQLNYKFNGATVYTTGNYQYDFVTNAYVDITIPANARVGDTFHLSNGYIGFVVTGIADFTNDEANHRGIGDDGCSTRGSGGSSHQRSLLPEIAVTVRDSEAEITKVIGLIDAIASAADKGAAVSAARSAYTALSGEQKRAVTNYNVLTAAEKALADAADAAAAEAVEDMIRQISPVTLEKERAIQAARSAYEALTQTQQDLVDPELLQALEAAENELVVLKDKKAAAAVDSKIESIGSVTLSSKTAIQAARQAYSALTNTQRRYVTKLGLLEEAEKKLRILETTGGIDYGLEPDEIVGYATVSFQDYGVRVEGEKINSAYANPRGVIVAATKVPFKPYDTIASVTLRLLKAKGITASYTGSEFSGFYLSAIDGFGEFSAGSGSGWMVTQNGWFINKGASEFTVRDGDVIQWQYTCQLGKDIGDTSYYKTVADVIALIEKIGTVTLDSQEAIDAARAAYDALTAAEKKRVSNYDALTAAEEEIVKLQKEADEAAAKEVRDLIDKIITGSRDFEDAVEKAKEAYDKLTDAQKKLVTNYGKLADALKELASEEDKEAAEEVEKLINAIGAVTKDSEEKIEEAREAYEKLTEEQKALVNNLAVLEAAEEKLAQLKKSGQAVDIYQVTGDYLEALGTPTVNSVGGEWMVIGLARSGREVPEAYYDNVVAFLRENIDENGRLHSAKSTENSRLILALTALGKDVTNVDGHNLLSGLKEMAYVQKQGINGPIWALIAFDSGNYPPPGGDVTRESLLQVILDAQLPDGGWALSGETSDPDMTGMALQALAPYYADDQVKMAVDWALETLSLLQQADGSFSSIDGKNIESIAQVVTALAALGIDAGTDPRFVKNGVSVLDALCAYFVEGGGFRHIPTGELDGMATEQGYYALTAYFRMKEGKTALYDMTDVMDLGGKAEAPAAEEETTAPTEAAPTEPVKAEEKGRPFPWWLLIILFVAVAVLTVAAIYLRKSKK